MAKKRFTDIEIWDREWYMELSPTHKCLIKYIFDKCDASGCWKPNWKLASLHINDKVCLSDLNHFPKDQYEILDNGKIFIPDFINFQYGALSKRSPAHNPIFLAIEKNNLSDRVFNRVLDTPKEEDIEEDKEKENKEEEKFKIDKDIYNSGTIGKMFKLFLNLNPDYPEDLTKDSTAILQIATKIGKTKGLTQQQVLNGSKKVVLDSWESIVDFIVSDSWFSKRSLFDLNNEWQRLIQSMSGTKVKKQKSSDIQV